MRLLSEAVDEVEGDRILTEFLTCSRIRSRTDDDVTLLLACLEGK